MLYDKTECRYNTLKTETVQSEYSKPSVNYQKK